MAKKHQLGRPRRKRDETTTVLLVTNGVVTERAYLEGLKHRVERGRWSLTVRPIEGSPEDVLKKVTSPRADKKDRDYDQVWIVVDHDGVDRRQFLRQCVKAGTKSLQVAGVVSVPCFEVWLVAHYERVRNYQDQDEAQRHYRELTGLASKNRKLLPADFPWDGMREACERSHLKNVPLPAVGEQGPCPSTTMPHLLAAIGLVELD